MRYATNIPKSFYLQTLPDVLYVQLVGLFQKDRHNLKFYLHEHLNFLSYLNLFLYLHLNLHFFHIFS